MIPVPSTVSSRADLHCHSTASAAAKLGIQRSVGLPECATPPEEVYELAKRRGMDFVTITDHDTIEGVLAIADRPDVFISEELTAWFRDEPQAVHVLCWGIDDEDHEWLQANARDLEACAEYLHANQIACALAHPFFAVAAPLSAHHRRRLARIFEVWETRNGARAHELNQPAAVYVDTHGGTGVGGSDDHAGVDIGRTFTETPGASSPEEFLAHIRAGRAQARGDQGSAAKWAHAAIALAVRTYGQELDAGALEPATIIAIAERVVGDGAERGGAPASNLGPAEARAILRAWLDSVDAGEDPASLIATMQADGFSHGALARRARGAHEQRMRHGVALLSEATGSGSGFGEAAAALLEAAIPALPYVPAATIVGQETAKLSGRDDEPGRVALIVDGADAVHGVTATIERIREHGVPGWEVEVIGVDPRVDRRLPAVAELELPLYPGLAMGVPNIVDLVQTLAEGRYDLIHVCSPGPAGVMANLASKIGHWPLVGSYHTELAAYAGVRSGDAAVEATARAALSLFYGRCATVLSPSSSADESLLGLGIAPERVGRWGRGVDTGLYDPAKRDPSALPGEVKILYAGRLTHEKGVDLLAESFLTAHERDPRLHLLLAGGGPEEEVLRVRLGDRATFLGWLDREQLATAYASSDVFLFCSETDTFGQVIVEAQASGLPVVAVDCGGPASLIRDRRTGWLCQPDPNELAAAVLQLVSSVYLRERVAAAALGDVGGRTWERSMSELAAGYRRAAGAGARKPRPTRLSEVA
jgi:glycosyltransferase involved in cell wall biosynthesis/predicted metal-dependent phosphoesterase TrpH